MTVSTICLNMIVKNEANIIVDTLDNIREHIAIDTVVICDTGSTDNTVEVIEAYLKTHQIKGIVHHHQWQNFEVNRNLALQACEGLSDYILVFDADDRFYGNVPQVFSYDIYALKFKSATRDFYYTRKILFKNKNIVKWIGVLHESIVNTQPDLSECELAGEYYIQTGHFGARNQDPNKYLKDAHMLQQAFEQEHEPLMKARYAYYCATSYYSHGDIEQAIFWFEQRLALPSSNTEETYLACRYLGEIYKNNNQLEKAVFTWLKGASTDYVECLYELSLLYTQIGDDALAFDFALLAKHKTQTFEPNILNYGVDYQIFSLGQKLNKIQAVEQAWQCLKQQPFYSKELTDALNAWRVN